MAGEAETSSKYNAEEEKYARISGSRLSLIGTSIACQKSGTFQSDVPSDVPAPSPSSDSRSNPDRSSFTIAHDDLSKDHENSSQSQTSSRVSDTTTEGHSAKSDNYLDPVERVINDELRDDPEAARLLFEELEGKLEYAPRAPVKQDLDHSDLLTMFNVCNIEEAKPIYHLGVFTLAPTSDSGSTTSSTNNPERAKNAQKSSGSNSGKAFGLSDSSYGKDFAEDGSPGQSTKQQKGKSILGAPADGEPHGLRCFHNAALPETFCCNHHTGNRFRVCAGGGWLTFQHLK